MSKEKKEPKLTRIARQISDDVAALPPDVQVYAKKVIAGLCAACTGMPRLPKSIEKGLWKIVGDYMQESVYNALQSTVGVTPAESTMWTEIEAGLSPELVGLIQEAMAGIPHERSIRESG